jgi:hypothetical protein
MKETLFPPPKKRIKKGEPFLTERRTRDQAREMRRYGEICLRFAEKS